MSYNNDDGVVVENFLGVEISFSAKSGKFSAYLGGGLGFVNGKTVDEVEKVVAEKFKPKRIVEVVQSVGDPDSSYFGMSELKVPEKVQITGFNIDRGRGRGASKTVEYTTSKDGTISVKRTLKRWNKEAADEMAALVAEKKASDLAFLERARGIARKFEPISAETIFEELNTAPVKSSSSSSSSSSIEDDVRRHLKVVEEGKGG